MAFEIAVFGKSFTTYCTIIRPLSAMDVKMALEIFLCGETFTTYCALI